MKRLILLVILPVLLCSTANSQAEVFSYTDDRGRKVFVDSPNKIPEKFRKNGNAKTFDTIRLSDTERQEKQLSRELGSKKFQLRSRLRELEKTMARMETDVVIRGNQVLVPVTVNWRGRKQNLSLLLDTGASMTVIHGSAVEKLNTVSRESSYAQVAGGGLVKTERVVFDKVSVGPYDFSNKNTALIDTKRGAPFDGLLGMDILASVRYQISFAEQKIIWSPDEYEKMKQGIQELKELQAELDAMEKDPQAHQGDEP